MDNDTPYWPCFSWNHDMYPPMGTSAATANAIAIPQPRSVFHDQPRSSRNSGRMTHMIAPSERAIAA